ncbi:hypothetical protein K432DRAFT_382435 [Lepidopterella palustris CBS 459.81]|uniref:Uncharacterized protein n=1 Tax=Lepidopterella palustris CBS 459.81 TaxID=1314670 RepID=A0A8E2EA24_9PEZI|nr:hypothetical protein K432DRAFT_382435 [Lepidopterella palustris CBS 459.81]
MNVLVLLTLLLFLPLLLLVAFLALSSCLGDNFRARFSGITINAVHASYGRNYARGLGSGAGQAGWEQIEMENILHGSEEDDL